MVSRSELSALLDLSAKIGRDPLLTQASTGNTSLKIDGRLWIKASGKWLADARRDDILVSIDLSEARDALRRHSLTTALATNLSGERVSPSIESAMHVVLPHRVVAHLHSVNTIAHAVRCDGPSLLESKLSGLNWAWIPYVASGLPLAREIEQALRRCPSASVLVLANHGLVVCGEDCASVDALLNEVELRIGLIPRPQAAFDRDFLIGLARDSNWRLPDRPRLHSLATDAVSRNILSGGVVYPCQALFLGGSQPWRSFYSGLYSEAVRGLDHRSGGHSFLIIKDKGILIHQAISPARLDLLIGLAEVVQRIEASAPIRYLTKAELDQIAALDSYKTYAAFDRPALSA